MKLPLILAHASALSPLAPLLFSIRLRKPPVELKIMFIIVGVALCFDLVAFSSIYFFRFNTYPMGNIFLLLQALGLMWIYGEKSVVTRRVMMTLLLSYATFFFINFFLIQSPYILNSYSVGVSGLILMVLALLYFLQLLKELPEEYAHRIPMVWINIAVLVYYSGNLFLFVLNNYFTVEGSQQVMWALHNSLNITKNLLFMVAAWQATRKK